MGTTEEVVIAGAGQAAVETATALRSGGYDGGLTLVGDEGVLPYTRPFLSKEFLDGRVTEERIAMRPPGFYERNGVRLLRGRTVVRVDRAGRSVALDDGEHLPYTRLVLATGGSARRLPDPVLEKAPNVHHVRTLADAVRLRADLVPGARLLAVGGGYVGLEVASVARQSGLSVTVLEAAPRLLARVAGAELASFAADLHRAAGVELRLGAQAAGYRTDGAGRVTGVVLDSGEVLPADVVVIGVGQVPRDELARGCGLETADGIVVDAHCRTADPRVYAVGDCTRHPCAQWGGLRRLESVANASAQGRVAAAAILGDPKPYTTVPWFWSTQYRRTLRTVGLRGASDTTVVRQGADGAFAAFHLAGGVLKAVDVVDGPRDFAAAKELVAAGARLAPDVLADPGVELRALAASL